MTIATYLLLPDVVEMDAIATTFHVNSRRRRCLLRIPVNQVFPLVAEEKLDRFHGRHGRDAVDPKRLSKPSLEGMDRTPGYTRTPVLDRCANDRSIGAIIDKYLMEETRVYSIGRVRAIANTFSFLGPV